MNKLSQKINHTKLDKLKLLGSGGLTGVGLGKGRQKYNYLPQIHNDYIFPAIAEELGYMNNVSNFIFVQFILGVRNCSKVKLIFSINCMGLFFLNYFASDFKCRSCCQGCTCDRDTLPFSVMEEHLILFLL